MPDKPHDKTRRFNWSETSPWKTLNSKQVYDNSWISVRHHEVLTPTGHAGIYGTVHFKNHAIAALPIDAEGYTWLVGQHRYPLALYSWEIPEGGGSLHADPLLSAKRELKEETGIEAQHWEHILTMHLSNSVTDEKAFAYIATGLTFGEPEPDHTEDLQIRKLRFDDVVEMIYGGEITDALTIATVLRAKLKFLGN